MKTLVVSKKTPEVTIPGKRRRIRPRTVYKKSIMTPEIPVMWFRDEWIKHFLIFVSYYYEILVKNLWLVNVKFIPFYCFFCTIVWQSFNYLNIAIETPDFTSTSEVYPLFRTCFPRYRSLGPSRWHIYLLQFLAGSCNIHKYWFLVFCCEMFVCYNIIYWHCFQI